MPTPASNSGVCELLPWDSSFFGVEIARLVPERLSGAVLAQALEWCAAHRIKCLYFLADPNDRQTIELAEAGGFHLVDIRVTLECGMADAEGSESGGIRLYQPGDLDRLKAIARTSHTDSRFFFDAHFPVPRAQALFECWIERSCEGWAQAVFVAEVDGVAAGYTTCHLNPNGAGSIGLVGLAPEAQGRGLGRSLVRAAVAYLQRQQAARITVVTQGRNVRALRLYQRCGFRVESVRLWYHRWAV